MVDRHETHATSPIQRSAAKFFDCCTAGFRIPRRRSGRASFNRLSKLSNNFLHRGRQLACLFRVPSVRVHQPGNRRFSRYRVCLRRVTRRSRSRCNFSTCLLRSCVQVVFLRNKSCLAINFLILLGGPRPSFVFISILICQLDVGLTPCAKN